MEQTDVIGIASVSALIEQSGMKMFCVTKDTTNKQTPPVFEYINPKGSNADCKKAFEQWAKNVMGGGSNCIAYEILLFNDLDIMVEDGKEIVRKSNTKNNKLKFSFCLYPANNRLGGYSEERSFETKNIGELVSMAVANAMAERDKADLMKELIELRKEVRELQSEEGEEIEESGAGQKLIDGLGAILLSKFTDGKTKPVALAGSPDEKKANINKAIQILYKHDKEIDTDLLKLAAIAENNTEQFNFLLNALRNM